MEVENLKYEIWKDVVGWEDFYQISNFARVKCKKRVIYYDRNLGRGIEPKTVYEKIRKLKLNKHTGYIMVGLNGKGKSQNVTIHSMIAKAFIRDYGKGETVNHKNGVKTDNDLSNLEIITSKENTIHAFKTGLVKTCHPLSYKGISYYSKAELRRANNIGEKRMHEMIKSGEIKLLND